MTEAPTAACPLLPIYTHIGSLQGPFTAAIIFTLEFKCRHSRKTRKWGRKRRRNGCVKCRRQLTDCVCPWWHRTGDALLLRRRQVRHFPEDHAARTTLRRAHQRSRPQVRRFVRSGVQRHPHRRVVRDRPRVVLPRRRAVDVQPHGVSAVRWCVDVGVGVDVVDCMASIARLTLVFVVVSLVVTCCFYFHRASASASASASSATEGVCGRRLFGGV